MNENTNYYNNIRQTANENLESLAPAGEKFDRLGAEEYIRSEWEIAGEAIYGAEKYITDILNAIESLLED